MDTPIDRRRSRNMKTQFCIQRMRRIGRKSTRLSPMSLLERFREAVFRLIMISALSKTTTQHENRMSSQSSPAVHQYYQSYDPHHSEAVADCIEFIKKSSATNENREYSTSSNSSISSVMDGDSPEIVIPLPVM